MSDQERESVHTLRHAANAGLAVALLKAIEEASADRTADSPVLSDVEADAIIRACGAGLGWTQPTVTTSIFDTHLHADYDKTHYYCPACWGGNLCPECRERQANRG